jgi:hypothetical protein
LGDCWVNLDNVTHITSDEQRTNYEVGVNALEDCVILYLTVMDPAGEWSGDLQQEIRVFGEIRQKFLKWLTDESSVGPRFL